MRRRLLIAASSVAALVVAFLGVRYSAPVKTRTETKVETKAITVTQWKDRVVEKTIQGPVRIRTVTREVPGGERVVERVVERGPVTTERQSDLTGQSSGTTASTAATATVSEAGRPGWAVTGGAEWDPGRLALEPERLEIGVDRRVWGTVWLGVRGSAGTGFSDPRVGATVRLEF